MNRSDVILELQLVPELLKQAEAIYVDAVSELNWAKHMLLAKECEVIGEGMVTGKNELQRQAECGHTRKIYSSKFYGWKTPLSIRRLSSISTKEVRKSTNHRQAHDHFISELNEMNKACDREIAGFLLYNGRFMKNLFVVMRLQ